MAEAHRSNRPQPRTPAAAEAELRRRIRAALEQARSAADGQLDDEALAAIIAQAVASALQWHLEAPEHTRNATLSSRTWRPAGGPRGQGPREGDFDKRRREREYERPDQDRDFDRPPREFDRPPRDFDRPRRDFDRPPRDFDRPPRDFDRPPRDFDRPPRDFDRPPRDFDRPPRDFDRPRRDFEGGPRKGGRPPFRAGGFKRGGGFGPRRPPRPR